MKTSFRKSFLRDLKKIKDVELLTAVRAVIVEIEGATDPHQIANLKKMSGTSEYYRIRVGAHRIGLAIEKDTVEFVRCLPRRDLYKYFP